MVICSLNLFVQAQATVGALAQTLGSPSGLFDRWSPSCLWASAHDGDIGKLTKTPMASRTAHKSKQLGSVYVPQRRAEYRDHSGDAGRRFEQKHQRPNAYQREGQYEPIAVLEAGPTQVFTKRHETGFYDRRLLHAPGLRQSLGFAEAPTRLVRCERRLPGGHFIKSTDRVC